MRQGKKIKLVSPQATEYDEWQKSKDEYIEKKQYETTMCLKCTKSGPRGAHEHDIQYIGTCKVLSNRNELKHKCVLPKGHTGKCQHRFDFLFNDSPEAKKLVGSISHKVYITPGNDDYVYKNRASRLYPLVMSQKEQVKIRDKSVKKKCCIPLKDATTPEHLAHASLDWIVYILNVDGVEDLINDEKMTPEINSYFETHKSFLVNYYKGFKRKVFNDAGKTICCVTKKGFILDDVSDINRDVRLDIRDSDLQMGHNISRSDSFITIRGCNLLPQSRRGNLIIGERKYTEDVWIDELRSIVEPY